MRGLRAKRSSWRALTTGPSPVTFVHREAKSCGSLDDATEWNVAGLGRPQEETWAVEGRGAPGRLCRQHGGLLKGQPPGWDQHGSPAQLPLSSEASSLPSQGKERQLSFLRCDPGSTMWAGKGGCPNSGAGVPAEGSVGAPGSSAFLCEQRNQRPARASARAPSLPLSPAPVPR